MGLLDFLQQCLATKSKESDDFIRLTLLLSKIIGVLFYEVTMMCHGMYNE